MKIPPGPLSPAVADDLSRRLTLLESFLHLRTEAPLTFSMSNGTPVLGMANKTRLTIKLTGHERRGSAYGSGKLPLVSSYQEDCRYSWIEQDILPTGNCAATDMPGGMRGYIDEMPAIEINGRDDLDEGLVVEAYLAPSGDHYRFMSPGEDGTPGKHGVCCFGAPTGIYAISGQTCCDSKHGFYTSTFYFIWHPQDCVPYIFTDRQDAIDFASSFNPPLDVTIHGECPPPPPPPS